jgi:hypothetical protein
MVSQTTRTNTQKKQKQKNNYQDDDGCPDTAPSIAVPIKPKLTIPLK